MPKMTENANECSEPLQRVQVVSSVSMDAVETMPQDREEEQINETSRKSRQQRQQRVYNMMKDLQQKHLANLMQGQMNEQETDMHESQNICRICHSLGDEPLITPCHCSGSAKHVHATCLLTWFKRAVKNTCELCRHKVAIKKKGKPYSEWRKPEGKPIPLIWFTVFLLGLFLNAFSIAINASELCMTTACIIFYVVNGFGVILDTVFLYFWWTKCLFYWRKWCALNQEWSIVIGPGNFAPQRTNEDEQRSSHRTTSFIQIPHIV